MVTAKIIGLFASIILFFWLFVFGPWYEAATLQGVLLGLLLVWNTRKFSRADTIAAAKFLGPFVFMLVLFGAIFQFFELMGRTDWIQDSLIKGLVFPNSFLFLKIVLSYITYRDLILFPMPSELRTTLIIIKAALAKGGRALRRFKQDIEDFPHFHGKKTIRVRLQMYGSLIIAAYMFLYYEIETITLVLANKQRHLRRDT
ncbi:MAG TPA: hypothetical protein VJ934_08595 [Desulfomicrobiaceae bacterium]|nr:hypothetical protein [Desulfomicrobiaceae bacterium]